MFFRRLIIHPPDIIKRFLHNKNMKYSGHRVEYVPRLLFIKAFFSEPPSRWWYITVRLMTGNKPTLKIVELTKIIYIFYPEWLYRVKLFQLIHLCSLINNHIVFILLTFTICSG